MSKTLELPWYNFSRLFSYNAYFNCVLGSRGTGKTFGAKVKGIKDAINSGSEFIYLRRYKDELKFSRDGFFADIIKAEKFPDYDFKVDGNKGYFAHVDTRDMKKDRPWKVCVYFYALSQGGQIKSQSFPNVGLLIYDEFVIERGHIHYLPNEVQAFLNFYSTIDRNTGRCRVLMLSNSVSIMNPYFLAWNIEPQEGQEWIIKNNGFIAVHFDKSEAFIQAIYQTPFGKFIKDTDYSKYAVENKFKDNNDYLIELKPENARYRWTLETVESGTLSLWEDPQTRTWYAQRKRPKVEDIKTLNPDEASPHKTLLLPNDRFLQTVKTAFRHGNMRFDKAQSRNTFRELF